MSSATHSAVLLSWAAKLNLVPDLASVTLANVFSGETCTPIRFVMHFLIELFADLMNWCNNQLTRLRGVSNVQGENYSAFRHLASMLI